MEVAIGVEEILRDRRVGAGFHFALEVREIFLRAARLRVVFGISGDLDEELVAELFADERDELVRVLEFTRWQPCPNGRSPLSATVCLIP